MSIETTGKIIDQIPVEISYRIIELFSAGLYSSPNKAFEELVSNSYDAGATKVSVYVPLDKTLPNSILWVADNGISMDKDGLKNFWKIGTSTKRDIENEERPPIGKFGIGKLATYILTNKLTLVCKAGDGKYYAVTMNYSNINKNIDETIRLDERELTLDEVKSILTPLIKNGAQDLVSFKLWGDEAEKTWTFAIMSGLKPKALEIKDGRLKWVISTALPLNPKFDLLFNGSKLLSSKESLEPMKTWVFGKDDTIAEKFRYSTCVDEETPCINLPSLTNVTGKIDLYRDSLLKDKAENWGRSNGIFLHIRNRLVNIDDPLLGMPAMTHGVFNRIRIIVHADNLDEYITSTRESIKESNSLSELKQYIQRKFIEVKDWYFSTVEDEEKQNLASHKIAYTSASLSRRPLIIAVKSFLAGEISDMVTIDIPVDMSSEDKEKLLTQLEEELTTETGIIQKVEWVALNPEDPIAKLDLLNRTANINLMHPFFANFLDEVKSPLPFQLIALTEILTEALLIEMGVNQDEVKLIMWRRDSILRELTFSDRPNAPVVASLLQASLADSTGLEIAVTHAFNSLGFEATRISGKKNPDGKAMAYTGPLNSPQNYSVTYDAKSTGHTKISAKDANLARVDGHRDDYKAKFCCVVGIDFDGATDDASAVNADAKRLKVSLIRVKDLMTLVLLSGPKQVGLNELREFFENCHTVNETSNWIKKIREKEINRGPIKELLEAVFELSKLDTEPAHILALRLYSSVLNGYSAQQLQSLVESLEKLVPGYISLDNQIVSLQAKPEKILQVISQTFASDVPPEFMEIYLKAFQID